MLLVRLSTEILLPPSAYLFFCVNECIEKKGERHESQQKRERERQTEQVTN